MFTQMLQSPEYLRASEYFFKFTYITDQLIHFGTREHAGEHFVQVSEYTRADILSVILILISMVRVILSTSWPICFMAQYFQTRYSEKFHLLR